MVKIMAMRIRGGDETYKIGPFYSMVIVQDEVEYKAGVLQATRRAVDRDATNNGILDTQKAELLRTIKIELFPTTLTELKDFPNTLEKMEETAKKVILDYESNLNTSQQ